MAKNKSINSWYWAGIICLPIFIYITLVSYFTPLMQEDFNHNLNGNVFFAMAEGWNFFVGKYFEIGGRIHYLIRGLLVFSFYRAPFDDNFAQGMTAMLNSLVFLVLLINLFFLAFARKPIFNDKNDRIRLFIIFFLMMTILAEKGETIFWLVGRTNYLWGATILSSFAVFYRLALAHDNFLRFHHQPIKHFLFIATIMPLAIAAGMTDYIAVPIVLGLLLFGFFYKIIIAQKKLPLWCYIAFVFFIIGIIILVIAPGNFVRYDNLPQSYHETSALRKIVVNLLKGLRIFLHETFYLPFLILPVFFYWQKNIVVKGKNILNRFIKKMKQDKKFAMAIIYLLSAFGFMILLGGVSSNSARVHFSGTCIFLLTVLLVIDFIFLSPNKLKLLQKHIVKKSIFIISSLLLAIYLSFILIHTIGFHREFENRVQSIAAQKEIGKDAITIKPYSDKYIYSRFGAHGHGFWNWKSLTSKWQNIRMAEYYGVKEIIVDKDKK